MKHLYLNLGRWLLPLCFIPCCRDVAAQNAAESKPPGQTSFIVHAPVLLPELLRQQRYDTIGFFLANWRNSDYPSLELIFSAEALLAIETGKFSSWMLPCDCLFFLSDYARELKNLDTQGSKFRYYLALHPPYTYDATIEARSLILFIRSWAREQLSKPYLDKDELFICHTLAGDIPDPKAAIKTDPEKCPRIAQITRVINVYDNAVFTTRRNAVKGTAAVLLGGWFPNYHLGQIVGWHPTIGVQLGLRSAKNEYDITWDLRFGHPTPGTYTVFRDSTIYNDRYYDGGYIGFEYTRYVIHKKYLDLGYTIGFGLDYFSIADQYAIYPDDNYLDPFRIASPNLNYGLRAKYFLKNRAFIGLAIKYNLIQYENTGGTNLYGNAFTVDLSFGSH